MFTLHLSTMCRPSTVSVRLCWFSFSVLLHGSVAFPNGTAVQEQEDIDWDSPFLHLRANLPSYLQPVRPYTLPAHAEDYRFMPKPRHRQPSRLLRLLGSSFDPFWMSVDPLSEGSLLKYITFKETFNLSSPGLSEAAANQRQKLEREAAQLDLGALPPDVAGSVRRWLVGSATCELHQRWVDLGPTFWPRWLRQTDCDRPDGEPSCSFPAGMECVRAQMAHITILVWRCFEPRGGGEGSGRAKDERSEGSTEMEAVEAMKRCSWKQVPYPVVTACRCSCKLITVLTRAKV